MKGNNSDSFNTYDINKYYVILPVVTKWNIDEFINEFSAKVKPGLVITLNNDSGESVSSLKD